MIICLFSYLALAVFSSHLKNIEYYAFIGSWATPTKSIKIDRSILSFSYFHYYIPMGMRKIDIISKLTL